MPLITGSRAIEKAYIGATKLNAIMHAGVNLLDGTVLPRKGRTFLMSKSSLILDEGTGGPTWSRATKAWGFNELGYMQELPTGCAVFGGARLVRNLCAVKSEDFSDAVWTKTALTAPSANRIVCANSTAAQNILNGATPWNLTQIGDVVYFTYRVQYVDIRYVAITAHSASFDTTVFCNFDLIGKTLSATGCTGTITEVSPGVFDIAIRATASLNNPGATATLDLINSLASTRKEAFVGDGVKSIIVLRYSANFVTGYDASYVPEYVSVGSEINKNFLTYTGDFAQAVWSKSNVTIQQTAVANPINGRVDVQKVAATATSSTTFQQSVSTAGSSNGNVLAVYVKQGSGETDANLFYIRNTTTSTNLLGISFTYSTGAITYIVGASGASAQELPNGWWKLSMVATSGVSDGDNLRVYIGFTGESETAGEYFYLYQPYVGRNITVPEVIPAVGNTWDPHGSGADGAKYFETDWQGAPIAAANLLGLRRETAATNNLLYSRDLSNAAWSTKTNITAAKTATGLDGIANTATTLTATAADAIILQPITLASAARCASAYVKRRTGTGTISFTQDGGSTWTDVTSLIDSSTWSRVQITSTLANPSVGFKLNISGDAIDVDVVQNEAGAVATSPIVTTTAAVTRNADSLTYQTAGNIDFATGTAYLGLRLDSSVYGGFALSCTANGKIVYSYLNDTRIANYDGVNVAYDSPAAYTSGRLLKIASAWGGATKSIGVDGRTPVASAFDGSMGSGATIDVGGGTSAGPAYIGPVAIYNYQMTDAELQAITA